MNDGRIETSRLALEPLVAAHADVLFEGLRDDRAYAYIPDNRSPDVERLRARYRYLERRRSPDRTQVWLNWALKRRDAADYIGYVQATIDVPGHAIIGYLIFPPFWKARYGSEAVSALVTHLTAERGIARIDAYIDARNVASRAVVQGLGFSHEEGERWSRRYQ